MKTSELTGALLDYWVARAEGFELAADIAPLEAHGVPAYSIDWALAGPIIYANLITVRHFNRSMYNYKHTPDGWVHGPHWSAFIDDHPTAHYALTGDTPLVAAMRTYVASKFGDTVPDAEGGA